MQESINERLKFLIGELGLSVRAFSAQLGVPDTNTRNYLDKSTKLNSEYLEKIAHHFPQINLLWLITGQGSYTLSNSTQPNDEGAIYATDSKKILHSQVATGTGNTQYHGSTGNELALAQKEIESLRQQLELHKVLLASKDETISALRGSHK